MVVDYFLVAEQRFCRSNKAINDEHQEREDNLRENWK
jgi:hypothetical protein